MDETPTEMSKSDSDLLTTSDQLLSKSDFENFPPFPKRQSSVSVDLHLILLLLISPSSPFWSIVIFSLFIRANKAPH